jgi:PAS domain S-box-containing protein
MTTRSERSNTRLILSALAISAGGVTAVELFARKATASIEGLSDGLVFGACLLSAIAIFSVLGRRGTWQSAPWLGLAVLALALVNGLFLIHDLTGAPEYRPTAYDLVFLPAAVLFLAPIRFEYRDHFPREERREIYADVALISVALAAILYLSIRPNGAGAAEAISSGVFAVACASAFSAYGALTLWAPLPTHIGMFVVIGSFTGSIIVFAQQWVQGTYVAGQIAIDLPLAVGSLALAGLVLLLPRRRTGVPMVRPTRYGRPLLTTASVATACTALGLIANMEIHRRVGTLEATGLIGMLGAAVAIRILVNQVRGTHATLAVQEALDQKEAALHETDKALTRLQRANETLRESEERLRLVFEAAVDGIVELDHKDVIVRANEAFCQMLELPQSMVEGQRWTALATAIRADESFASLPHTGQGQLFREGQAIHLETRTSEIRGDPPRRLLLVRDVTAARVADQTIRSLFKFLQDRDEDRTRIMRRTNAAIEGERNRIARDLHDGPVQGVSAASLSLEAVLLMLRAGETEEGIEILSKVRKELSEEADNLRRLMSGLRPPLLEERGLVPALRETLDRFGRESGVATEFTSDVSVEIPQDLQTLAYRIVQEALSNVGKHSKAGRVGLTVETIGGQIRIEAADDGVGFDPAQSREYLRMGRVGLASMRERVELANGTFMVHSTPGRGTTVFATLPLESVPAQREFAVEEA